MKEQDSEHTSLTETPSGNPVDEVSVLDRFICVYSKLDKDKLASLESLYHPGVVFEDPAHKVEGWPALEAYFRRLFTNVTQCTFTIEESMSDAHQGYVVWTMTFAHPKLSKGELRAVKGCSHLTFLENRVVKHRDYFDLGEMLYEAIPVLGHVVKKIKAGL
ncbi:nuclear transport factor 2 family protein [Photobacterium sp. Hal280]|uniref:nuclear transport factor 2 family protein n=1 Tax=Photobacterium sp. Hal280 TaxID=3035163 RepID=UPI00301C5140